MVGQTQPRNPRYGDVISEWPIEEIPYGFLKAMAGRGDRVAAAEMRRREQAAGNKQPPRA